MTARRRGAATAAGATVAAGIVRGLMEFAVSRGASPRALAACADLDPAALRCQDGRVPLPRYVALMRAAQALCGDPALALHFGESVELADLSVVGHVGAPQGTLADSIAQLNRFAPLAVELGGGDRFRLVRAGGQAWLVDDRPDPNAFPELTESVFARAVCGLRRWAPGVRLMLAVHVSHPAPVYRAEYHRIFQVPVVFGADRNALLLSADAWSALPAPRSSRYASSVLRAHAEALLDQLVGSRTPRFRVEALLRSSLAGGNRGIAAVAREIGISRQTLFRRLREEGVTFEQLLDQVRLERALQLLSERGLSVKETACQVGFSDPAAFSRAFKRWTGARPSALRRKG